jgi:alanine dehydrogenase
LPYALHLANKGWKEACLTSEELRLGLNVVEGHVVYKAVADAFGLPLRNVGEVLLEPENV